MQQEMLFIEDEYEALRVDIMACGGNKKVGSLLWPEKSPDKAGELLSNSTNRDRPEKLDLSQIKFLIRLAKQHNSYAYLRYTCDDTGFTRPEPIDPKDEQAELQRQFIKSVEMQKQIMSRLEKVGSVAPIKGAA